MGGDAIVSDSSLGGSAILAGLSVSRDYSLDPYFVRGPMPRTQGFALTPSTVDVYVNGVLVRQEQVKAERRGGLLARLRPGDSGPADGFEGLQRKITITKSHAHCPDASSRSASGD